MSDIGFSSDSIAKQNIASLKEVAADKAEQRVALVETMHESLAYLAERGRLTPESQKAKAKKKSDLKTLVKVCRKRHLKESDARFKVNAAQAEKKAKEFSLSNPELNQKALLRLHQKIVEAWRAASEGLSDSEIIEMCEQEYSDHYLANCAMEFLQEVSEDTPLETTLEDALARYQDAFGREIQIGKNLIKETQEFADSSSMSPSSLREWYKSVVDSRRGAKVLTPDLMEKMIKTFGYAKTVKASHFFLRGLGAEVRSGNHKFEVAELSDKLAQIRMLQANLQVFRSSRKHMRVLDHALNAYISRGFGQELPKDYDFVRLAVTLMSIVKNRHVSSDLIQVKTRSSHALFRDNLAAVICIVQQKSLMLDDLDPNRVFLSQAHREEVREAFRKALTELYNMAQPELEDYVFSDEEEGDGAQESFEEYEEDEEDLAFDSNIDSIEQDPELKKVMEMFKEKGIV